MKSEIIFIAHRGNINGAQKEKENSPNYIQEALNKNLNVEIDVWWKDGYFLGHDKPQYEIDEDFLMNRNLWIHAKNIEALQRLKDKTNCFFHDIDDVILTSHKYMWVYPGKKLVEGSIAVMPERANYSISELMQCYAICTDEVETYKNLLKIK
jgi:hypothetical protein